MPVKAFGVLILEDDMECVRYYYCNYYFYSSYV